MRIYTCPEEVPAPKPDYSNYDHAKTLADEAKHQADLKDWAKSAGYKGKYTGEIYREPVADGHAEYMVADGSKFCLIHLPYGDGYQSRNVGFLTKKEIIRRLGLDKKMKALWAKKD